MAREAEAAFAELYRDYRTRLHQYALSLVRNREAAEDAVQDAFLGWVRQLAAGKTPRQDAPYLYASVRNRCLDRLRRRPEVALEEAHVELLAAPAGDEERIGLRHALNRLLRGYGLPEAPRALDLRVLAQAERILARARTREAVAGIAREFGSALGFGYVNYVVDLVTATDAEYRVELI